MHWRKIRRRVKNLLSPLFLVYSSTCPSTANLLRSADCTCPQDLRPLWQVSSSLDRSLIKSVGKTNRTGCRNPLQYERSRILQSDRALLQIASCKYSCASVVGYWPPCNIAICRRSSLCPCHHFSRGCPVTRKLTAGEFEYPSHEKDHAPQIRSSSTFESEPARSLTGWVRHPNLGSVT